MRERPILFSAPMVRSIISGAKSQTRRLVKPQPPFETGEVFTGMYHPTVIDKRGEEQPGKEIFGAWNLDGDWATSCPYGQPGGNLWVRETWMADPPRDGTWPSIAFDGCKPRDHSLIPEQYRTPAHCLYRADGHDFHGWTPAIHMFRWASRITLEVTSVRVERLQDISEADAQAEGCADVDYSAGRTYRHAYRDLWESINGEGAWSLNPWVWVVEFRKLG